MGRQRLLLLLVLLLGSVPCVAHDGGLELESCGGGEGVAEGRALVEQHPWSGRAWQVLREAFLEAGCTGDALLAADLVARFYRSCACDTTAPDIADAREAAAEALKAIQHKFFEERGGKLAYFADGMSTDEAGVRCCGAKVHLEMGGSQPVLLGGNFDDGSTQAAWREAHLVCPRYFGQCQQTSPFAAVQQDMLLHMLFGDKLGGVFVDVGTVDGFSFSNTYFFERNLNWTGICVEPNRASLDVAQRVRSKAAVYNSCVANESSTQDFVQCTGYTRMLSGLLSSMTPQHHQRIRHEIALHGGSSQVVKVPVQRLGDILVREGIGHVDVLSIDTEGAELQVLHGIHWPSVSINVIILEMLDPSGPESQLIHTLLLARGYRQHSYVCQDAVFVHSTFEPVTPPHPQCIHLHD